MYRQGDISEGGAPSTARGGECAPLSAKTVQETGRLQVAGAGANSLHSYLGMLRYLLLWIWLLGLTGMVLYLLLRPSPSATGLPLAPGWLVHWLNNRPDIRTLPMACGYAMAAALLFKPGWGRGLCLLGVLLVLLVGEVAQLFLPLRSFSWADVGYSVAGVALAQGLSIGLRETTVWIRGASWGVWRMR
jgi:hypothetical protein